MHDFEMVNTIAKEVDNAGGQVYLVGGCVRDELLGIDNKDIDIEVFGLSERSLIGILSKLGELQEVGRSFGVFRLKGHNIDIALPRREKKSTSNSSSSSSHRDFEVRTDPFISISDAVKRRDITINGIMKNALTKEIVDNCGGVKDLESRKIRHIDSNTFVEDPLRVFRVAQFAARLNFDIDSETLELCKSIDTSTLSKERVFDETAKALLKSNKPSIYFESLREMNQLDTWFSKLHELIGIKQNQLYHKEDVWTHTMLVLDEAAKVRELAENKLGFMMSALCHDLGKIVSTYIDDRGNYHSYGHEEKGVALASELLAGLTNNKQLTRYVLNMVKNHMKPNIKANNKSRLKSTNKMFYESICPNDLVLLSKCDELGRIPSILSGNFEWLLFRLDDYNKIMEKPYVKGKDLVDAGIKPGAKFKELLEFATKLRLAGIDKDLALRQVLALERKMK